MAHAYLSIGELNYTSDFNSACVVMSVVDKTIMVSFIFGVDRTDFRTYMEQVSNDQQFVQTLQTTGAGITISGELVMDNQLVELVFPLVPSTSLDAIRDFVDAVGAQSFYVFDYHVGEIYEMLFAENEAIGINNISSELYSVTVRGELV